MGRLNRRLDVLVRTNSRVDDPPAGIHNCDVGCRGSVERSDRRAVAVPQECERHRMPLEMSPHAVLALIHRDSATESPLRLSRVTAGGVSPTGMPITSCAWSIAGARSSSPAHSAFTI